MRILRFMGYPINNYSTLERMIVAQAKAMQVLGHDVHIAFDGVRRQEAADAARADAPGITFHFDLPPAAGFGRPGAALRYGRAASALIAAGNYDIVHTYFDPAATILNQVARFHPRVRFLRTLGSTPMPARRAALDTVKRRKWVFDTAQMRRVICVGAHIGDILAGYGVGRSRLVVVPNATDTERFNRRAPHRDRLLKMAFVGRMDPVKNLPVIIEGMRLLVEQGERDLVLTIVGDGVLREQLLAQVARSRLEPYVHFAGHVSDIPGLLNDEVDLYVQASDNEGCPAAVIEAMACAVPVLLSNIPGHRQVATPDVHGAFFERGDAAAFAAAVRRIKADYPRYRDMAVAARQHIVDTFGIDSWIGKELAVYQNMMNA